MSTLTRLQAWYSRYCDEVWEHKHGVVIESCDNPGWWVKVDLAGTPLQSRPFAEVEQGVDREGFPLGPRWMHCRVVRGVWHGAGDETQLEQVLERFLAWAEANDG